MDWRPIETAPKDGTPVRAVCGRTTWLSSMLEFTARYVDGRWCARFDRDEWKPITPDPSWWKPKTQSKR